MLLKVFVLGATKYVSNIHNRFDGAVAICSIYELVVVLNSGGEEKIGLTAIRSLRLFKLVHVLKKWVFLRILVLTIVSVATEAFSLFLLFLLFVLTSALVGSQLFAQKFHFDPNNGLYVKWMPMVYNDTSPSHAPWSITRPYSVPRANFDNLLHSLRSVCQVL